MAPPPELRPSAPGSQVRDVPAAGSFPIDPMLPAWHRVLARHQDTDDTFTLEFDGGRPFEPGQFNMLALPGVGEVPISISGDPDRPSALLHTTRAVGAVTQAMATLRPGDHLGIRGPYGRPWPLREVEGRDVVVIAGGIGLAPLRPAIYRLLARRERFGRLVFLYGGRSADELLYTDELEAWRARFDVELLVTVDRASDGWRGNVGVVTQLVPRAPFDPKNAAAFVCGPEVMMRFGAQALLSRGVSADRVWVSLERNMHCGVGLCGHCQLGPLLICRDGPVVRWDVAEPLLQVAEL